MSAFPSRPQLVVAMSVGVVAAILGALIAAHAHRRPLHGAMAGDEQPRWRPSGLVEFVYGLVGPLVDRLARRHVRPNHVTAISLVFALGTGMALGTGYVALGTMLLVATGLCDLLDGHLAREAGIDSPAGAFFDSFADRITESFVLGGLAYFGAGGWLTWLAVWALVASLAISYARARGEGLGVEPKVGVMQRPERMTLLFVALTIATLAPFWSTGPPADAARRVETAGVGLLAVSATVTAIRRAWWTFSALRTTESPRPPPSESRSRSER